MPLSSSSEDRRIPEVLSFVEVARCEVVTTIACHRERRGSFDGSEQALFTRSGFYGAISLRQLAVRRFGR
jgi:hypothetical protein